MKFFSALLSGKLDTSNLSVWSLIALPWSAFNALIVLLAAVGLVRAALRRHWALVFACLIPVALFSAATFPVGLERFRIPFMPFLFVLAACAVWPRHGRCRQPCASESPGDVLSGAFPSNRYAPPSVNNTSLRRPSAR